MIFMIKVLIFSGIIVIVSGSIAGSLFYQNNNDKKDNENGFMETSKMSYNLNLMSGKRYDVANPSEIRFSIINQKGEQQKEFDVVHEKKMHVIIVRKDRSNFQHVHPEFDQSKGIFTLRSLDIPKDGEYRMFADFTSPNAKRDDMGMKESTTLYEDVVVGDTSKYQAEEIDGAKLKSSANGLDTSIFEGGNDGGGSGYSPGVANSIAISVDKDGEPFKQLESYMGSLGHMVALGPNLEFINAHPQTDDIANQVGVISFSVNFPKEGIYKLYLQTQAKGQVINNDYTISVKPNSN